MKKLLKILAALVSLLILALISIPFLVSAEYLKGQLVAQVKAQTGRTLEIKGDASLKLFPNIAVKVEDATLGNPPGFKSKYFLHVAKLETGAALKPLLNKELIITGLALDGAVLNLEQTGSGAKNWEFKTSAAPAPEASQGEGEKDKKAAAGSPLKQLAIGTIAIRNTAINVIRPGQKPLALDGIDLTLDGADGSKPLKLNGSARYQGEKVGLKLNLEKSKAFLAGKSSPLTLDAQVPSGKVNFKGTATNKQAISADGALDVSVDDLPKLLTWATGKPAAADLPHKLSLKGGLFMQNDKAFALKEATFSLDALSASGALAISLEGAVPSIKGALKMTELNLDTISNSSGSKGKDSSGSNAATAAPAQEGWSNAPIDTSGLKAVNANLKLAIGKLISGKVEVSNISTDVVLNNGMMRLMLGSASLYGGTAKGDVTLDGSGSGLGLGLNLNLAGVNIDTLMTALSGASKLEGTGNLTLDMRGRGASERALVSSLAGKSNIKLTDGAIKGINIASFLRRAQKGFLVTERSTEKTDFTELSATLNIVNGIASNDDLAMKSPVLRLSGKGTVNLPQKTVNYRLVPSFVGTIEGQGGADDLKGIAVPLMVAGPWSQISVTPDFAGAIEEGLKDPKALKENIRGVKNIISDFNSPKDLKRALLGEKPKPAPEAPVEASPATQPPAPNVAPATTTEPTPEPKKKTKDELIQEGIGGLLNQLAK